MSTTIQNVHVAVAEASTDSFFVASVAGAPFRPAGRQHEVPVDELVEWFGKRSFGFVTAEDEESRLVTDHVDEIIGRDEGMRRRRGLSR